MPIAQVLTIITLIILSKLSVPSNNIFWGIAKIKYKAVKMFKIKRNVVFEIVILLIDLKCTKSRYCQ